jgi:L-asparagine oxygenase
MNRLSLSPALAAALARQGEFIDLAAIPVMLPVPADLLSLQQTILNAVNRNGFVVIENLPDGRNETLAALMLLLGRPVHEAKAGPMIMDIKPTPHDTSVKAVSYYTWNSFNYHTDLSFADAPPDLITMICVLPDARREGLSLVADSRACVSGLSDSALAELQQPQFTFGAPAHYRGESLRQKPILTRNQSGHFDIRVRFDKMTAESAGANRAVRELYDALAGCKQEFFLERNSGYIVDNRRLVHGRSAFTPSFDAHDRHLKRIYGMRHPG